MDQQTILTIGGLAIAGGAAAALLVAQQSKKKSSSDIYVPPGLQRTDLDFITYGTFGEQAAETKDWVTGSWQAMWEGLDKAIIDMNIVGKPAVVDMGQWLFSGEKGSRVVADGSGLREAFDKMRAANALQLIKTFVPWDEPNLDGHEEEEALLPQAIDFLKSVVAEYPELAGVDYGCTFTSIRPYKHLNLFQRVGFDHYSAKSSIFKPGGEYQKFIDQLDLTKQKTWLFPDASNGQSTEQFLNFANTHLEVAGIIPFIYRQPHGDPAYPGFVENPAFLAAYKALGTTIVNARA